MTDWVQLFLGSDYGCASGAPETALFVILLAFVVGQFIGWIYMWTHHGLSYSQTFVVSLVVVPVLVALMMLLMAGSVVFAFGLLAVFAVVRFRNVLKDTRDTTFILWAILEGLGIGTMRYSTSLLAAVGVAAVLIYLRATEFGSRHRFDAVLNLRVTGDPATGTAALRSILRRHSLRALLTNERHLEGAAVNLSYRLLLRDPRRNDELKTELEQADGFEQVSLFLRDDESEI
ncbi:MAG: DUF4956 domain-containing protein [Planctomycetaceae bacterium]|nr:DUF4956 domain-containing protein [Planctomycetaceae bacterium]